MKKTLVSSLVIVLILSAVAFGQFKNGQKAPDFTLPDLDGNYVTLSEITGEGPVYINFWATWCGPCKKEIPSLIKLYDEYKDRGFKLLGISTDGSRSVGKVKSMVKDRQMNFSILLDTNKEVSSRKYKCRAIPMGFLVDNDGNIVHTVRGYVPGLEKMLGEKMEPFLMPAEKENPEEGEAAKKTSEEDKEETKQ
ncbi:MAG: TlpA family protein disulfide reductase [candidate division Zixibacteria bacterium]|nr:TlpA family protein disulfide reductase [candidate division Zixibacteria bacterium]